MRERVRMEQTGRGAASKWASDRSTIRIRHRARRRDLASVPRPRDARAGRHGLSAFCSGGGGMGLENYDLRAASLTI
jgi:hypothetical protein